MEITLKRRQLATQEAQDLKEALEKQGLVVYEEIDDGHKSVDLFVPTAKLDIEVDGIHHLTNPAQIVADLSRGYYSHKDGYDTMHIPNEMVRRHLKEISEALAEACKIRESKLYLRVV